MARRKKRRCRTPCECGWRANRIQVFRHAAQEIVIWDDVKRELRDLDSQLRDPRFREQALSGLRARPIVGYYPYHGKRYMVRSRYFGRETARGFYVVRGDICRVWFVNMDPRTNATCKRKRVD